ncbi:MAG: hypothetical protein EHM35_08385 [Planctomycetaceae bacterium]|nr:MAG: hypothetical protein EHM35_08385 [Planctomycetaceae bacterium]
MEITFGLLDDLLWYVVSGGAGVLAYAILAKLDKHGVQFWTRLDSEYRTYVAYALSGFLGILGYLVQVVMLIQPQPADWRGWVCALVAVAFMAAGVSKITYAKAKKS